MPRLLDFTVPDYEDVRLRRGRGYISLECIIDRNGRPVQIEVVDATVDGLVNPTLAAVEQYQFEPLMFFGVPVEHVRPLNMGQKRRDFVYDPSMLDQDPQRTYSRGVTLPESLYYADNLPPVLAVYTISDEGWAHDIEIVESENERLGRLVREGLRDDIYSPPMVNGRPVFVRLTVEFTLLRGIRSGGQVVSFEEFARRVSESL